MLAEVCTVVPHWQAFLIQKDPHCAAHPESLSLCHLRPDLQLLRHMHHKHVDDALDWRGVHLVWLAHVPEPAKHGRLHHAQSFQSTISGGACHSTSYMNKERQLQDTGLLDNSLQVGLGRLPLPLSLLRQQTPHPHLFPIRPMQHDPQAIRAARQWHPQCLCPHGLTKYSIQKSQLL